MSLVMKKLIYLLVAGSLSVFAACGGASTNEEVVTEDVAVEEAATEDNAGRVRSILGSFLFSNDEVEKKIKVL